jgi:peptidoglycan/xylan/chitin deacetylase (PgdA/CDA1 family)
VIPQAVERRARWVLDTIGARDVGFGDDVPYDTDAWAAVDRGERPRNDPVAEAFFHLARLEELATPVRDAHGRFAAASSGLDPLDPPLERLRASLGVEPPRWGGARFAVALTHDVDVPWRWSRVGVRGGAARVKAAVAGRRGDVAVRELRALAAAPVHRARGTDPNWTFDRVARAEAARGARSTFFVMAGHAHRADGPSAEAYRRVRPRLVATLLEAGAEVGLHGSYTAAEDETRLAAERATLEAVAGPVEGQRFHYLRVDPHANLGGVERLGFAYDSSLGFADAIGFRAGIAHPFRPWAVADERARELIEIPLAVMDATLGEARYLGLDPRAAETRVLALLDWAAEHGGGFAILWHNEWFDGGAFPGWGPLYFRLVDAVAERGGVCVSAGELAEEAAEWLS